MNRCYQIIWSKTRFARVVVSELARTRGKKGGTARKDLVKSGQGAVAFPVSGRIGGECGTCRGQPISS